MPTDSTLDAISPFFIVNNLAESIDFYNQKLGFAIELLLPEEDPFFAIVHRDSVRILLKQITKDILPVPNHIRHQWARWDAFVRCSNPDVLFSEFEFCGVQFHEPLKDTEDGLRAFEVKDNDGYVLCFGSPL